MTMQGNGTLETSILSGCEWTNQTDVRLSGIVLLQASNKRTAVLPQEGNRTDCLSFRLFSVPQLSLMNFCNETKD